MMPPPRPRRGESPPRSSWRSCRIAIARNSLVPAKGFSIRCRHPYLSRSCSRGFVRFRPAGITALATRPSTSSSSQSAPDALSSTWVPNRRPSRSSGTPLRSCAWPGTPGSPFSGPLLRRPPRMFRESEMNEGGGCGKIWRDFLWKTCLLPSAVPPVCSCVGALPGGTGWTDTALDRDSRSVRQRGRPALPSVSRVLLRDLTGQAPFFTNLFP